ncbi:hypothetical protein [Amphritea balenae]|uniref:Uncharacterized protein n=1 Tax=Amphritea balenae TaxID=452629 RepID=A0A3P1SNU3_9GAMM|nr:hypothetical protein [Amphritea balenae]RRC98624.1 hypothetical protein EHS89_13515 [Amphritea balenae]GGK66061.1 hypothetical protein GCM10007941_15320 [Amphritea balenae]
MIESISNSQLRVTQAVLASTRYFGSLSLLLAGICSALLITGEQLPAQLFALTGIICALLYSFYHWRVQLDSQLLPLLANTDAEQFDRALHFLFPGKVRNYSNSSMEQRLQGIRRLFYLQLGLLLLQSALTCISLLTYLI